MSVTIEVFTSPTCSSCEQARKLVNQVIDDIGSNAFEYREVDITEDMDHATELGVRSTPSIAIDGDLTFTSVPKADELKSALQDKS